MVRAEVIPDRMPGEVQRVSIAEAGRHMALIGSCAAALHPCHAKLGRSICYPVCHAVATIIVNEDEHKDIGDDGVVMVEAECDWFDSALSKAAATTRMTTKDGATLAEMTITYHVIPKPHFYQMNTAFEAATGEAAWAAQPGPPNPYATHPRHLLQPLPEDAVRAGALPKETQVALAIDEVDGEMCMGHFEGLPAFPVSVMVRFMVDAIVAGQQQQQQEQNQRQGDEGTSCGTSMSKMCPLNVSTIVHKADLQTHRWVWAGERAVFCAWEVGKAAVTGIPKDGVGNVLAVPWRCCVLAGPVGSEALAVECTLFVSPLPDCE
jgi:hypothetical protein